MAGRIEVDRERCKGCSFCVVACPVKIISLSEGTNGHSYHYAEVKDGLMVKCTGCRACGIVCPDVAIEVWRD
jgi:2-oxoglutarate ferredoxin oxidoreductase subunit delta